MTTGKPNCGEIFGDHLAFASAVGVSTNDTELLICELRDGEGPGAGPAPYPALRLVLCFLACSGPLRHHTISFGPAEIYARMHVVL